MKRPISDGWEKRETASSFYRNVETLKFAWSGQSPHFQWDPLVELRSHFQFDSGRDATAGHVGPIAVVSSEPFGCVFLSFLSRFKDVLIQPCVEQIQNAQLKAPRLTIGCQTHQPILNLSGLIIELALIMVIGPSRASLVVEMALPRLIILANRWRGCVDRGGVHRKRRQH